MIPKVIHYCWFGRKPLPKLAIKCIESWKKYLPDYEIKQWNEDNFDVEATTYTKMAYQAKRYAFVSDYARFWILYKYGGIYFDTDVEVIRPMDDIVSAGPFMGCETSASPTMPLYVAPGLGIGCTAGNSLLSELINRYSDLSFVSENGVQNLKTIVQYTTEILYNKGLKNTNEIQYVNGFWIYPKEYFNPMVAETKKIILTPNTRCIHHFAGSWITNKERFMKWIEKRFGSKAVQTIHWINIHFITHLLHKNS